MTTNTNPKSISETNVLRTIFLGSAILSMLLSPMPQTTFLIFCILLGLGISISCYLSSTEFQEDFIVNSKIRNSVKRAFITMTIGSSSLALLINQKFTFTLPFTFEKIAIQEYSEIASIVLFTLCLLYLAPCINIIVHSKMQNIVVESDDKDKSIISLIFKTLIAIVTLFNSAMPHSDEHNQSSRKQIISAKDIKKYSILFFVLFAAHCLIQYLINDAIVSKILTNAAKSYLTTSGTFETVQHVISEILTFNIVFWGLIFSTNKLSTSIHQLKS